MGASKKVRGRRNRRIDAKMKEFGVGGLHKSSTFAYTHTLTHLSLHKDFR